MGKSVAHQEIAKFIVDARNGNWQAREQGQSQSDYRNKKHYPAEKSLSREPESPPPAETKDLFGPLPEDELKNDKHAGANQELMERTDQRFQIRRVRTIQRAHGEDNTGERVQPKMVRN
jgi:hypothetical protein